jgi:hypothetical protein
MGDFLMTDTREVKAQLKILIEAAERGLDADLEMQILAEVANLVEAAYTSRANLMAQLGHLIRPATSPPQVPYPNEPQWDAGGLPRFAQQN